METEKPRILKAFDKEDTEKVPFWYMRQAGRYLPEYNEIRRGRTFLELSKNPELATEVTLQPHLRYGMDGIIMFADILTPINGAGIPLHFDEGVGPVLEQTITSEKELHHLDSFDPERNIPYIGEILGRIRSYISGLQTDIPGLLGFAGAPFTLASYLIEGGTTRRFEKTKASVYGNSPFFHKLSERLAEITSQYLIYQIDNGAEIVQIFDSWGGILSKDDYHEYSAPYTASIIQNVRRERPDARIILFVGNGAHLLQPMVDQNPDAISLDWRVDPSLALQVIPESIVIQGNLDPLILYGNPDIVRKKTAGILDVFSSRSGYIFNLGHGIHPKTPLESVQAMIETVRKY